MYDEHDLEAYDAMLQRPTLTGDRGTQGPIFSELLPIIGDLTARSDGRSVSLTRAYMGLVLLASEHRFEGIETMLDNPSFKPAAGVDETKIVKDTLSQMLQYTDKVAMAMYINSVVELGNRRGFDLVAIAKDATKKWRDEFGFSTGPGL